MWECVAICTIGHKDYNNTCRTCIKPAVNRSKYADASWRGLLSESRLAKAKSLHEERARRGQKVDLLDCLQFGDKGWILSYDEEWRKTVGYKSRREMREALKELEMLRNNLAHTQEIIPQGWQRIFIACCRLEQNM